MTWATIHYLDSATMAVEFPYSQRHKDAVVCMSGAEFDKVSSRWAVSVARLGDVVKLFWPNVTIDYAVLCARDEQLQAMFRGYMAMGVRFDVHGGKVVCDHALLNEWFAANSNALHINALMAVQLSDSKKAPCEATGRPVAVQTAQVSIEAAKNDSRAVSDSYTANGDIALWLRGVVNAQQSEERKADMLRKKRERA